MVGLIEKPEHVTTQWFRDEGDAIILLGDIIDSTDPLFGLGGSAFLQRVHGLKTGTPPRCNLQKEVDLHLALRALIHSGVVKSAHDCSDGGLAIALAECCISQQIARDTPRLNGAQIDFTPHPPPTDESESDAADSEVADPAPPHEDSAPKSQRAYDPDPLSAAIKAARLDALLFGETQARIIISVAAMDDIKVLARAKILGVPAAWIGTVGGDSLKIKTPASELSWQIGELHDLWWNSIARAMK